MTRLVACLAAACLLGATASAQGASQKTAATHDIAGRWIPDADKSAGMKFPPNAMVTVSMTDKIVTIKMDPPAPGHEAGPGMVFSLDGKPSVQDGASLSAAWKGDKLMTTFKSDRGEDTTSWYREGEYLVREATGAHPSKIYLKKATKTDAR
jgi:hypothetical protein